MLYFATKPDAFFAALVDTALADALNWVEDSGRWHAWAYHAAEGFPNHEAPRAAVLKLRAAHRKPGVHRMSHFYWVALYDIVAGYAVRHNARCAAKSSACVDAMPLIGSYRCGPIQMPSVVATYWWDLWCFPDATCDGAFALPPSAHRIRGGPDRYAPAAAGLVEIGRPKWAANPDAAELEKPGVIVPRYPLFTAPAVSGTW